MIRIKRNFHRHYQTSFECSTRFGVVQVRIAGHLHPKARRAIGVEFFRLMRPWLSYLRAGIIHDECATSMICESDERGITVFEGPGFQDPTGSLGFEIRMARLHIGLTQDEFAKKAGLDRAHLSEVERGRCKVRPDTLARIRLALQTPQNPNLCSMKKSSVKRRRVLSAL